MTQQAPDDPHESTEWWSAFRRTVDRLLDAIEVLSTDKSFAADLATVLRGASTLAVPPTSRLADESAPAPPEQVPPIGEMPSVPDREATEKPLPPLTLGEQTVEQPAPYPREWTRQRFDPSVTAGRCRMKAEAARWQAERRRLLDEGRDVIEEDRELVERARAQGVYLWMVSPSRWRERDEAAFNIVANCYEALAEAAELMQLADRLRRSQADAMKLLAEAQSALRCAVESYGSTQRDEDQEAAFAWLRKETSERRVFVEYMQIDHPADPENHSDLRHRIGLLRANLHQHANRELQIQRTIKKISYHARRIQQDQANGTIPREDHDLRTITEGVESLLSAGLPPTDARLREALLPIAPLLPDQVSEGLDRVLRAIDEFCDQRAAEEADAQVDESPDALVQEARQIVQDRHAVMIGGVPRDRPRLALLQGLGLASLEWLRVEHHESFDAAERAIRREGVSLVIILTRWRAHRDGPAARSLCRQLGISLIELPGGYNLRQVAHQILQQLRPA